MLVGNTTACGQDIDTLKTRSQALITVKCDGEDCDAQWTKTWERHYSAVGQRIRAGKSPNVDLCKQCTGRATGKRNKNRPNKTKGIPRPHMRGEKSSNWKGGSYVSNDGYRMVYAKPDDYTGSGWKSYRREHRHVVEQHLGRSLDHKEVVHHIDGDKLNNSLDNLALLNGEKAHREAHNSLEECAFELVRMGLITYDKATNTYIVAQVKPRELLETPEEGNQQPSLESNLSEGSETNEYVPTGNMNRHERGALPDDDPHVAALIAMGR